MVAQTQFWGAIVDLTFPLTLPRLDGGVEEPRHVPDPLMRGDGLFDVLMWCVVGRQQWLRVFEPCANVQQPPRALTCDDGLS